MREEVASMRGFIVDEAGNRRAVILDIEEYERLIEAVEDAEDSRIAQEELRKLEAGETERIPWEESKRRRREAR